MDWYKRAQEKVHTHKLREFILDGSRFVVRRTISRALVATLTFADSYPTSEFRFGSRASITIDEGKGDLPDSYRDRIGTYQSQPTYVKEFQNVRLSGPYALGIAGSRKVIAETAGGNIHLLWPTISGMIKQNGVSATTTTLLDADEPEREYKYAASLVSFNAHNYYHWVIEHLPQLRGIAHYAEKEGVMPVLILPQDPPQWMIESLEACGYDESDWVEWTGGCVAVDHLIVTQHPFRSMEIDFLPTPENWRWLRERTASTLVSNSANEQDYSSYIYISREDAESRRVTNREELLNELQPLGFESYVLSEMSFEQQIVLFNQAEIIVAPHGAGATNMVLADNAMFIELSHSENIRGAHFFMLAQECGHEYVSILCKPSGKDMIVDIQSVLKYI